VTQIYNWGKDLSGVDGSTVDQPFLKILFVTVVQRFSTLFSSPTKFYVKYRRQHAVLKGAR
jgi:hypothetical protein